MKYIKDTPRINVKFVNGDTEDILFEISDRSWMNVGEIFTDHILTSLMEQHIKNKPTPKNLIVMAVAEFKLQQ